MLRGQTMPPEQCAKIAAAMQGNRNGTGNLGHAAYPGSGRPRRPDVTYTSVHKRLRKERGTPSLCEHCGTTTAPKFEWAYSGPGRGTGRFVYSADLAEYVRRCTPCHYRFDQRREVT